MILLADSQGPAIAQSDHGFLYPHMPEDRFRMALPNHR